MSGRLGRLGTVGVVLAGCLLVGTALGGCGSGSSGPSTAVAPPPRSQSLPNSPSTTRTTIKPTPTTSAPSAADDLAAYFVAATTLDQRLKAAAAAANGDVRATQIAIGRSTLDAIAAADPSTGASAIPAGLPPEVLLPVLTVQGDLVARYYAFRGFTANGLLGGQPGTLPVSDQWGHYLMTCLANGSRPAASFSVDMAAARAAASHAPRVGPVDPGSQAAADLALWLHNIVGENSGCMSCGGYRVTALAPITWHQVAPLVPGGTP